MQPTSPRLTSDVSAQPGYAPIAPLAVAALGLACLYVVVLLYLFIASYFKGLPLTDAVLLAPPALAAMLAFVARRQIRASEGTRTGEQYANAGWWVGVVSGVVYIASLLGNNFTVQRDASDVFRDWAKSLAELDALSPKDPALYEAAWLTLPPGTRPPRKDYARMDAAFANEMAGFRATDLARVCMRNRGALQFVPQGLKEWEVRANEIVCTLTATLTGPEGDYGIELPMRAAVNDRGQRNWQIKPPGSTGFVRSRNLTKLGWEALALEADGGAVGKELLIRMASPGQGPVVYLGYVRPGGDPNTAATELNRYVLKTADLMVAAGGGPAGPANSPAPPDWPELMSRTLFVRPDGTPQTASDALLLLRMVNGGGQVLPAGGHLRNNLDVTPVLVVRPDKLEMRLPIEMPTAGNSPGPTAYKGRLVLELPAANAGSYPSDRAAGGGGPKTTEPPADIAKLVRRPWRLVRLEADLKTVVSEPPINRPAGG